MRLPRGASMTPMPFAPALAARHEIRALQIGIVQKLADLLDAVHHLDHPRPVIGAGSLLGAPWSPT
jgi:hypothetical protein